MISPSDDLNGKTIKGYELQQLVGSGGFGAVYRAYQPIVNREVAIKVIHSRYVNQADFIRRFEAEARIIARLEHLHIVPLYDFWRDPEGAFLVMRWFRGGNLREKFAGNFLNTQRVTQVFQHICSAIAVAHRNNIIHCDLKPDNILLDSDGNAYLTDFGIAQTPRDREASNEEKRVSFGSPAYMAPEVIVGLPVSPQSDIYSLAILLFELLTGRLPFQGETLTKVLDQHLNQPVPSIYLQRKDLPARIDAVIWRAAAKPPEARYSNVMEFAQDFLQVMEQVHEVTPIPVSIPKAPQPSPVFSGTLDLGGLPIILNPYKGLRSFEEGDTLDFFGRDELVNELLDHLRQPNGRFIAVIGPSGSGKSSVVKAGLVPELRKGALPAAREWFIVSMTPTDQPLMELQTAIERVAVKAPATRLKLQSGSLSDLTDLVAESLPADQGEMLLVIDQFEELFTLVENEAERAFFLEMLNAAVSKAEHRFRVVVALRADFYDRPLLYPEFGQLVRQNTIVVLPLSPSELVDVIRKPAGRADVEVDEALLATIISDVREQPGALPLLQYTLTELFERHEGSSLTLQTYHKIGGVTGTLAQRADDLYATLSPSQQGLLRQIFLQLVNVGDEPTRRRVLQSDLLALSPDVQPILELFNQSRLLTFDREATSRAPTVEVAHEALISQWQLFKEWIANNREDLQIQRRLAATVHDWLVTRHDPSYLASGARLMQFSSLQNKEEIKLTADEQTYLSASLALQRRNTKRWRLFVAVLITLTLLALAAAGFAANRQATAATERDRANQQADISRSRELAVTALTNLNSQTDLALLLSLEALQAADTFEARRSLFTGLQFQPHIRTFLHGQDEAVRALALSPNGTLLAANAHDNSVILWDTATWQPLSLILEGNALMNALAFSPDGQTLAAGDANGSLYLWNISDGQPLYQAVQAHQGAVWSLAFSPDGQTLASGGADSLIGLWDVATGKANRPPLEGHSDIVYAVRYSPNGKLLASGSGDNLVRLWDASTGSPLGEPLSAHQNWVLTLAFSPDGLLLASSGADANLILWNVAAGTPLFQFPTNHSDWVRSLAFSPDGRFIATGSADDTISLWDITTGQAVGEPLAAHSGAVWSLIFSPQDARLISGGADQKIIVWDTASEPRLGHKLEGHTAPINALALSPDGGLLVSASGGIASDDNSLRFWDLGSDSSTVIPFTAPLTSLAFSPDGQLLATGSADRSVIFWDVAGQTMIGQPHVGHQDIVWSLAFSADRKILASGSDDGKIVLWDVVTQTPLGDPLDNQTGGVLALAFDGQILVSGDRGGIIQFWDAKTGKPLGDPLTAHSDAVTGLVFSPDGRILASSSRDGTVRLWRADTHQAVGQPLVGHSDWVLAVAFSPDGRLLASASSDQSIILWDTATFEPLGQPLLGHTDWVNALAFSQTRLISGGRDNTIILWDVSQTDWEQMACQLANRNLTPNEWERYFSGLVYHPTCQRSG